jgi:hypothetical protein
MWHALRRRTRAGTPACHVASVVLRRTRLTDFFGVDVQEVIVRVDTTTDIDGEQRPIRITKRSYTVVNVLPDSHCDGRLRVGDVVLCVDGRRPYGNWIEDQRKWYTLRLQVRRPDGGPSGPQGSTQEESQVERESSTS